MSLSNTFENRVATWLFTADAVTRPTSWYLAAFTTDPAEDASGTEVSTSGTAYARQSAAFTVTGDTASNSAAVEFPTATANWGTVTHIAIFDAVSGGNMIAYGTLAASKLIETGDVLRVDAGALDVTVA